jgi:hypothetical protein
MPTLKYLTPFLLNGLLILIVNLFGKQNSASSYGLAVYILLTILIGLVINVVSFFVFILNKEYKIAAIHFVAISTIVIFLARL